MRTASRDDPTNRVGFILLRLASNRIGGITPGISGAHGRLRMRSMLIARPLHAVVRRRASARGYTPGHQMARVCPTTFAQEFAGLPKDHNQPDPILRECRALQPRMPRLRIRLGLSVELDWCESLNEVALADD